jgi:signal transduction histidine kinase
VPEREKVISHRTVENRLREAVNNALKHAQASHIVVELKDTQAGLCAGVVDDGRGFDVDQVLRNYEQRANWGMFNIREQAELIGAQLSLESAPGRGTRLRLYVPKLQEVSNCPTQTW